MSKRGAASDRGCRFPVAAVIGDWFMNAERRDLVEDPVLFAAAVLAGVDLPRPPAAERAGGRPLRVIVRQPRFVTAAVCGVVSYSLMNLVMTTAPLAMRMCGLPLSASNFAIQWHIVAMYGPSFFTGSLIARFGAVRIAMVGMLLLAGAAGVLGPMVRPLLPHLAMLGVAFVVAYTMPVWSPMRWLLLAALLLVSLVVAARTLPSGFLARAWSLRPGLRQG